jgi:hypothetical protein
MKNEFEQSPDLPPSSSNLQSLEAIIEHGLPNMDSVAEALLRIHEQRLYREDYGSLQEYVRRRWGFSRARAYQLLHLARLKRMSTMVDAEGLNERQARLRDAEGKLRKDAQVDLIQQAMSRLGRTFERLPRPERREFIQYIRKLLNEMEQQLDQEDKNGGSAPIGSV